MLNLFALQPSGRPGPVQADLAGTRVAWTRSLANRLLGMGLAAGLGGCASLPDTINPVAWWHGLQGGAIAEQRPPPPGASDPDPSLGTVPPKPAATDAATQKAISDALIADRANAQHAAEANPLPDPSSRTASPALFGAGTIAPPGPPPPPGSANASLAAATAPPPPPTSAAPSSVAPASVAPAPTRPAAAGPTPAPARAPTTAVQAVPLTPPGSAAAPTDAAALPAMPTAPPALALLPGVAAGAPGGPAVPATPLAPAIVGEASKSVSIAFPPGSSTLSPVALGPLKLLAAHRGKSPIAVTGYGESPSVDPDAQSKALTLGLARARAVAAALATAGVPAADVQVAAEATGRGALAHLLN